MMNDPFYYIPGYIGAINKSCNPADIATAGARSKNTKSQMVLAVSDAKSMCMLAYGYA
jgi:hypothetical protein